MPTPVIAIDGPSGSGKGTVARRLAAKLNWHLLDSGALYRLVALAASQAGLSPSNPDQHAQAAALARELDLRFGANAQGEEQIRLRGEDVTAQLRAETTGDLASQWAALPRVRGALLDLQHSFRRPPGLVADGRDMGTVVFTDAPLKIFLEASVDERAQRRLKQLSALGISANIDRLCSEIAARDTRDRERPVSPLKAAADAVVIDSSRLSAAQVVEQVEDWARKLKLA
ncbi:MAG: (d)CMP kinase [Nevskiales bacterium]